MGMIKIPAESIDFFKENLDGIFESGNLAENVWNEKLTNVVKDFCKVKCAIPTASNGSGIVALLQIYKKYYNKKRVLIQSNTMYGVKTMVASAGDELAGYIDCSLNTLMPTIEDVKNAIAKISDPSTLIVLISHIGGIINPDIEEISNYCAKNNIILTEDCAHSYGATHNGRHSGTFGDAGVFSFYATKAVPAGEGGVVITKHEEIGAFIKDYVIYDRFKQKMEIGVNIRLSEVQALFIYSVVKEVNEIIYNKSQIAKNYIDVCKSVSIPYICQDNDVSKGNYYKFILLSNERPINEYLPNLKTVTSPVYDYALGGSIAITKNHACLPIWYGQAAEVAQRVVDELKSCFESQSSNR